MAKKSRKGLGRIPGTEPSGSEFKDDRTDRSDACRVQTRHICLNAGENGEHEVTSVISADNTSI